MKTNKSKKENQVESKKKRTNKTSKKTIEGKRKVKEAFGCQSQFQNVEQAKSECETEISSQVSQEIQSFVRTDVFVFVNLGQK